MYLSYFNSINTSNLYEESKNLSFYYFHNMTPYYPTTPMEIILLFILCLISLIVVGYMSYVLYKCMCSRNYAEWRASWGAEKNEEPTTQFVLEAVPTTFEGHSQEIECVAVDGTRVISSCLAGQIFVWDTLTMENVAKIDRKSYFTNKIEPQQQNSLSHNLVQDDDENQPSDYESSSPTSCDENSSLQNYEYLKQISTENFQKNYEQIKKISFKDRINLKFSNGNLINNDFSQQLYELYLKNDDDDDHHHYNDRLYNELKFNNSELKNNSDSDLFKYYSFSNANLKHLVKLNCEAKKSNCMLPQVWCIDYADNLIVLGCSDGRLEFWEGTTGNLKYIFDDSSGLGITHIRIVSNRIIAAKLNGHLDFLLLESYNQGKPIDWCFTSAYRRTHVRTNSAGSINDIQNGNYYNMMEDIRCIRICTLKAHHQPITVLECGGGRVITGSQDHTLRAFKIDEPSPLYTLHGHYGPITCLFIDQIFPVTAASGSYDGMLCVWDLHTGTCVFSIQAHDGPIMSFTYSASYIISLGADEKLCVWERFQGHLLNTIQVANFFANSMIMLTECILVTSRQGSLIVWNVRTGEIIRSVTLGDSDSCMFVKQIFLISDTSSVICDYFNQLKLVKFPLVHNKFE